MLSKELQEAFDLICDSDSYIAIGIDFQKDGTYRLGYSTNNSLLAPDLLANAINLIVKSNDNLGHYGKSGLDLSDLDAE